MKKILIPFFCCLFIFFHFFNLSRYLINFPNWGDDFIFLAYFKDLPQLEGIEFWKRTTEFHSYIHRFPFARFITAFYAIFQSTFDFKALTILANLLTISVIYPLAKLLNQNKVNQWHLIALVGLLYAPNGNLDNFALIGVLQHTTSLVYLIWISYWLCDEKSRSWGIWLSLLYPAFSTEGLAFIPCVILFLVYLRDSRVWIYSLLGALVIYLYFTGYAAPETIRSSGSVIDKLSFTIKGTIVFVGGAVKKDFWTSIFVGGMLISHALFVLWKYHKTQNKTLLFSGFILIQLMAVGAMITLGRGNAASGDVGALFSERFSTYGIVFILITYFAAIQPQLYKLNFGRLWLLIPALIWIGISTFVAQAKLENLNNRLVADASNAYYFKLNTWYPFGVNEKNLLNQKAVYQFPSELLSIKALGADSNQIRLKPTPRFEPEFREFEVAGKGTLLVYQNQKPTLFLPINALSHRVKIKKDIPFDERTSKFVFIPRD